MYMYLDASGRRVMATAPGRRSKIPNCDALPVDDGQENEISTSTTLSVHRETKAEHIDREEEREGRTQRNNRLGQVVHRPFEEEFLGGRHLKKKR